MAQADRRRERPSVLIDETEELIDCQDQTITEPDIRALSVLTSGCTLLWRTKFRQAVREVCEGRGSAGPVPAGLRCVALPHLEVLLLIPAGPEEPEAFPVHASAGGHRVSADLWEAFSALGAAIPAGIVVEIPVTTYESARYGHSLALHFQEAVFRYKQSNSLVTALQPE